jgi:NHL repeat
MARHRILPCVPTGGRPGWCCLRKVLLPDVFLLDVLFAPRTGWTAITRSVHEQPRCRSKPATAANLEAPDGVAADGAGNVLIADSGDSRIRVVATATGTFYGQAMIAGDIYTVAGNGEGEFSGDRGPATEAGMNRPKAVTVDGAGNLLIAGTYDHRVRVVAATTGTFYGKKMIAGDIYTVAGNSDFCGVSGDGGPGTAAGLCYPRGVSADGAGNLLIADGSNDRIQKVTG